MLSAPPGQHDNTLEPGHFGIILLPNPRHERPARRSAPGQNRRVCDYGLSCREPYPCWSMRLGAEPAPQSVVPASLPDLRS